MTELTEASATKIVSLIARREISVREVATKFLERVEALNPVINAVVTLNPALLDEAEAADQRLRGGARTRPLEGVPFVVKDNIATKGLRTTFGSLVYERHVPSEDAVAVERLRAAGAVLIGKSNIPEFATDIHTTNKLFGPTRNPADLNCSAGGSSGGTAAAIAADMAPIGLGTDLGGSIRIPSAWCGTTGIRPTPGRVPVHPTDFAWDTLVEHVQGPMARTVADLGLVLSVLSGPDDRDPSSLPEQGCDYGAAARQPTDLRGRRIAYSPDLGGLVPLDREVGEATRRAAMEFEAIGCIVEEASFDASDLREIIAGTRAFALVARFADLVDQHADQLSSQLTGQVNDALQAGPEVGGGSGAPAQPILAPRPGVPGAIRVHPHPDRRRARVSARPTTADRDWRPPD